MRIAVLGDVHGNIHAFEKVANAVVTEAVDEVVFLGDIAFFGLYPQESFDMLQSLSPSIYIKGNTDANIEGLDEFIPTNEFEQSLLSMCRYMDAGLNAESKKVIASWEIADSVERNGVKITFCHGSPYSYKDQLTKENTESFSERIRKEEIDFVICGHTHQPTQFQIGETEIVNCGAIGYSFDGDTSAGYGLVQISESGQVEIDARRVEYDIEKYRKEVAVAKPPFMDGLLYSLENAKPKPFN